MVADEHERARLLDAFWGDNVTNGLLQQLLRRFPSDVRNRYLDLYGDLVRGGYWSDSDVEVYGTDEGSYHGDSVQEAAHNHQQFVETAEADNRSMIARTEFAHLVQFLLGSEGGTTTLEAFRAHLQHEGNAGRYLFQSFPLELTRSFWTPNMEYQSIMLEQCPRLVKTIVSEVDPVGNQTKRRKQAK